MNSPIWRLAGVGLLCLSLSAQTLADDNDQHRPDGGGQNRGPQQEQRGQADRGQPAQQQMQQQVQQQQRAQQQELRGQQQQMQQQQRAQQQELRGQQQEQRGQQQQTQWQQRQQEFNQRQAERLNEQQNRLQQNRPQGPQAQAPQPGRQDSNGGRRDDSPIQGKPGVAWQNQPPMRGNNEGPRGNYAPGRPDDHRGPGGRGNGWGPGPQYRPGYTIDRFPDREYRVPYRGQDFFYSGGYWYRPQGPRYVVVAPPYGIRTRQLPDYATRMWIGGAMFFLAAGTYYQYMDDSQDYIVVNPPQDVPQSQPQPVQGDGIDVTFYPANGQSPSQMEQDRYDCQRYAAQQSGFDPATATYAPADSVAYLYRQNMGNCLVGRGYQVN